MCFESYKTNTKTPKLRADLNAKSEKNESWWQYIEY